MVSSSCFILFKWELILCWSHYGANGSEHYLTCVGPYLFHPTLIHPTLTYHMPPYILAMAQVSLANPSSRFQTSNVNSSVFF